MRQLPRPNPDNDPFNAKDCIESVAPDIRKMALEKYEHHFSPEELVGFIYATYRAKYAEFCAHGSAALHFGLFLKHQALSVTGAECPPAEG